MSASNVSGPDADKQWTGRDPQGRVVIRPVDARKAFAAVRPILAADFDRGGVESGLVTHLNRVAPGGKD